MPPSNNEHHSRLGEMVVGQGRRDARPVVEGADLSHSAGRGGSRRRVKRTMQRVLLLAILAVLGLGVGVLWASGWLPGQFTMRKLVILGCNLTEPEHVLAALDVSGQDSYGEIARSIRSFEPARVRWLADVDYDLGLGRKAQLSVSEHYPVLRVKAGSNEYWLCSDSRLIARQGDRDMSEVFARIDKLPLVKLGADPGPVVLSCAEDVMITAAALQQAIPGIIASIEVTRQGELVLVDADGFKIHLGEPVDLPTKIAALPKALRICSADRGRIAYLDASNPELFYQKWKEPQGK